MSENIEMDLDGLVAAAEAAAEDGPYDPRLGLTDSEANFACTASPAVVLELVRRLRIAEQMGEANLLKISASEGDTLVIRYTDLPMAEEARRGLAGTLPPGVRAVLLPPTMEISALDENAMRAAGWVRAERGDA